jgi:hypothetical protein
VETEPSAAQHRLTADRSQWWDGTQWVPAEDSPEAQTAINRLLDIPTIEPLPPLPPTTRPLLIPKPPEPVAVAVVVAEPVIEVPEEWADLSAAPTETIAPEGVSLSGRMLWEERATTLLHTRPTRSQLIAAVAVVALALGIPLELDHRHDAAVARDTAALTEHLRGAARFENLVHTYDGTYVGPSSLRRNGWTPPTDASLVISSATRQSFCLTARHGDLVLTLRSSSDQVSHQPC